MALTYTFGIMVKAKRQGTVIFITMMVLLCAGLAFSLYSEYSHNPFPQYSRDHGRKRNAFWSHE